MSICFHVITSKKCGFMQDSLHKTAFVAQRKGFEPLYTFLHNTISNRARSTAPPSLHTAHLLYIIFTKNATVFICILEKNGAISKETAPFTSNLERQQPQKVTGYTISATQTGTSLHTSCLRPLRPQRRYANKTPRFVFT